MGNLLIPEVWSSLNKPVFQVHPLFWVVMLLAIMTGQMVQVIVFFVVVLLHELGHFYAAKYFQWRIRGIELLPFGGIAHVDEWGNTSPKAEMVVALAGPFVNLLLYLIAKGLGSYGWLPQEWAAFFMYCNVLVGGFNLLPIWPLDGGRIMHTLYSLFLPYRTSVLFSIVISLLGSLILVLWSIKQPMIHANGLAIAFYLLFSNIMSYRLLHFQFLRFLLARYYQMDQLASGLPSRKVWVPAGMTVKGAVKMIKRQHYQHFITSSLSKGQGVITEKELLSCFFEKTPHCAIEQLLR